MCLRVLPPLRRVIERSIDRGGLAAGEGTQAGRQAGRAGRLGEARAQGEGLPRPQSLPAAPPPRSYRQEGAKRHHLSPPSLPSFFTISSLHTTIINDDYHRHLHSHSVHLRPHTQSPGTS